MFKQYLELKVPEKNLTSERDELNILLDSCASSQQKLFCTSGLKKKKKITEILEYSKQDWKEQIFVY